MVSIMLPDGEKKPVTVLIHRNVIQPFSVKKCETKDPKPILWFRHLFPSHMLIRPRSVLFQRCASSLTTSKSHLG